MNVRDLMTEPAFTCSARDTLQQVADQMRERNVGALVVVTDDGLSQAIVTDRDICITAADVGKPLVEITVEAARSAAALLCDADDPVTVAHDEMRANAVRRLVVVDENGHPIGMLSIDDLAAEALREVERGDSSPVISPEELVRTFGEIARAVAHGHLPVPPGSEALPRTPA